METKKTKKANLEKGKTISFMMGAIVALAILFTGFEWGAYNIKYDLTTKFDPFKEVVEPIVILPPDPIEPPKPEVISPVALVLVDNKKEVDPIKIAPSDFLPEERQPVYAPIVIGKTEEPVIEEIYVSVEIMPAFPGGDKALFKWLSENVNYPVVAAENGIEGLVACAFVVNTDGTICDVQVIRSIDPLLDKEAARVIGLMPKWSPGVQQGKNVRVRYTVPVRFRLQK